MIQIFVNYPVCKKNLAPYWKLDELNITVENLYQVIENVEHEIYLDEIGLCIKVFSQDDAKQLISSTKDRYDRFNHDVKITQDYLKQYASDSCINVDEESASKIFAGAIAYASTVFVNRLALGGSYRNTKNCKEIVECLKQLRDLIKWLEPTFTLVQGNISARRDFKVKSLWRNLLNMFVRRFIQMSITSITE